MLEKHVLNKRPRFFLPATGAQRVNTITQPHCNCSGLPSILYCKLPALIPTTPHNAILHVLKRLFQTNKSKYQLNF